MTAAVALLFLVAAGEPTCNTADPRVEKLISAKVAEAGGAEYCQYRFYRTLDDVDGDGVPDFVIVFGVESGASNIVQYLAVFRSREGWSATVQEVGHRWERLVDALDIEKGIMVLKTLEYLKGDAGCCPSGHGELRFSLKAGRLVKSASRPTMG